MILNKLYLGLEINMDHAMISTCVDDEQGPETLSPIAGETVYQIPVCLAKRKGLGQWFYGDEAIRSAKERESELVEDLFQKAMNRERVTVDGESFDGVDLLALYIGKLLLLARRLGRDLPVGRLCVVLQDLTVNNTAVFKEALQKNDLTEQQFLLIDTRESFYYYALSQKAELTAYDNALFDYSRGMMRGVLLSRNEHTVPQVVTLEETNYGMLIDHPDEHFSEIIAQAFNHRIISTAYLTGDGFEGSWMKESLKVLCRGRKAYVGRNLYSKGACHAALIKGGIQSWNYAYIGDNELKFNVSVRIREGGEIAFLPLLSAGESWYEAFGSVEAILDGDPSVDFWLQEPRSREARIQSVELLDFPERENKTTRLRISARPLSDTKIKVTVKDLGFGDIARASEMHWEYTIHG